MLWIHLVSLLALLYAVHGKLPLEDAIATVDQFFSYTIDPADFPGQDIKVTEANKDELPSWLDYNKDYSVLMGVPTSKDLGTYVISVGQEMFAVTVAQATKYQLAQPSHISEATVCSTKDPITVVYVRLNTELSTLGALQRGGLISSLSNHLSLQPKHISLSSSPADLLDSSKALVHGPGDVSAGDELSTLSWIVGCGAVKSHHMDILEKLENSAKDGGLGRELQVGVGGWQVQSNQPKVLSKRRLKRQVQVTATLTTTPAPPPRPDTTKSEEPTTTRSTEQILTTTTAAAPQPPPRTTTTRTPRNQPPEINHDSVPEHIPASGGQLVKWTIPDNLFSDPEGGKLVYSVRSPLSNNRWMVTNKHTGSWQLIGLAYDDLKFQAEKLKLTASDESGLTATQIVKIKQGHDDAASLTQTYKLKIRESEMTQQPTGIVDLAYYLEKLAGFEKIVIESNERMDGVITLVVGDHRGLQSTCPTSRNREVVEMFRGMVGEDTAIPDTDLTLHLSAMESVRQSSPCVDKEPEVNREKLREYLPFTVVLGELYESTLPLDLFVDWEDGDLSKLAVKLLFNGQEETDSWVSYDPETRLLQAFTLTSMDPEPQLTLKVEDSVGNSVEEEIEVRLVGSSDGSGSSISTNEVTLTVKADYSAIEGSPRKKVHLYKTIKKAFPGSLVSVKSMKEGSVVVGFSLRDESAYNTPDSCPKDTMEQYKKVIFGNGEMKESFVKKMSPYNPTKVYFAPKGPCVGVVEPESSDISGPTIVPKPDTDGNTKDNKILLIIVIVVVVITVIVLIVIIVVCIRKRKAEKSKNVTQNGNDIEKRVPVVLDEEMKSLNRSDHEPLMISADGDVSYKPTSPPYPGDDDYQPDTPPVSEPDDERRILDRSP